MCVCEFACMRDCVECLFVRMWLRASLINYVNTIETGQSNSWQDIIKKGYGCIFSSARTNFLYTCQFRSSRTSFQLKWPIHASHRARLGDMKFKLSCFY